MTAVCKITDMAAWRAAHARPINDACRWSQAVETIIATNLRIWFAWHRVFLRALTAAPTRKELQP